MSHFTRVCLAVLLIGCAGGSFAQIPKPDDAPLPLSPEESAQHFQLPAGFRMELVASEPLVREPSGVCWDERGQLFVCELHGYNLEGQYDIEELNKTGKLDRVVRRIQADERHKKAAEAETYGTIKRLHDNDDDGRMDRSEVWADRLPPCLGICPARGGIIAACQTQVLFLADRDGDGTAEVREVLFEGFEKGPLERSINSPQWGPDNWIYLGAGAGGGTIQGKYLKEPVQLPRTDFRIRPDGSAIQPVVGATHTMGHAFTESGDRFVISTRTPGIFIAPLEWRYLARNPNVPAPRLEHSATSDVRAWPTSEPHPWRIRRAEHPEFSEYYSDRYGMEESTPNGYFTSACSPLVYQDVALPGLNGQLLACEPAQNFVHRALVEREGARLTLRRAEGEEQVEFLTSSDPWFHAIALSHAPDGSVFVADFYREIIEDYSAIPRYLQQQYGLIGGRNHGRLWRLTHENPTSRLVSDGGDMSAFGAGQLAAEVASPHFWRRQTARRLLVEQQLKDAAPRLVRHVRASAEPAAALNALATLDGLDALDPNDVAAALDHADANVRRRALRFAEEWLDAEPKMLHRVLALASDESAMVRLQVALSLGESRDSRAMMALVELARSRADEPWMASAILTAVPGRGGRLLAELLGSPDQLGQAAPMLEPLCTAIANRRDPRELSQAIVQVAELQKPRLQALCLRGLRSGFPESDLVALTDAARESVMALTVSPEAAVREQALPLISLLRMETAEERRARLARAASDLGNLQLSTEARLAAVWQLGEDEKASATKTLLAALPSSTRGVREAILESIFSRGQNLPLLLDAIEANTVPAAFLNSLQRARMLEAKEPEVRERAAALLQTTDNVTEQRFQEYTAALRKERDLAHGQQIFRETCGNCHQAHGIGHAVGPDLSAEFLRAEETIIRDVLTPSDKISPDYVTYTILTTSGRAVSGLLADESPTSITLRQAEGKEQVILRKNVEQLRAMSVSMMPDDLNQTVKPQDLADALGWLRRPPARLTLLDENRELLPALDEGSGTADFVTSDKHRGQVSLQVTPPQRYSPRIPNWEFRIRENPGPGEYRYLRFAWKSAEAEGVMLELADNGRWPSAEQPLRRYHAGRNTTGWASLEVSALPPRQWTVVTRDLWQEFGEFTLTGIAPTAIGGPALFDRIELLQLLPSGESAPSR